MKQLALFLDSFDIDIKYYSQGQANVTFNLNGGMPYSFRLRKVNKSFEALTEWLKDISRYSDNSARKVSINDEELTVFLICSYIGINDEEGNRIGEFIVGDSWDGDDFSFVAPINTVVRNIYHKMIQYVCDYPEEFRTTYLGHIWDNSI